MPRVPQYDSQVQQAAVPGARLTAQTSPDTFGAAVGAGARDVGHAMSTVYAQEKKRQDQVAGLEASNRASVKRAEIEQAGLAKRGKDAFGLPEQALEDFDKYTGEIETGLSNEEQRQAFTADRSSQRQALNSRLVGHTMQETRAFDAAQTEASVESLRNEAIANPGDAETITAMQRERLREHAQRNGLPAEWFELQAAKAVSGTHLQVLNGLAQSGDAKAAADYRTKFAERFEGPDAIKASAIVAETSTRSRSQEISDEVLLKVKSGEYRTLSEQIAAGREAAGDDASLRDAVDARIKDNHQLERASQRDRETQLFKMADEQFRDSGNLDDIDPGVMIELNAEQREELKVRSRQIRLGEKPVTDWTLYYDLMNSAVDPRTAPDFMNADLSQSRSKFADPEWKELVRAQQDMRAGNGGSNEAITGYRTAKQIVDESLEAVNKRLANPKSKEDIAKVTRFRQMVDERAYAHRTATGKKAGSVEIQKFVDELLMKEEVVRDWWFDGSQRGFEATEADDVPPEERVKILDYLIRKGQPTDAKRIAELYRKKLAASNAGE